MDSRDSGQKNKRAECTICTIQLVGLCYERTWWFRIFREPLVYGMRLMAWLHKIESGEYEVRTEKCYGCLRFIKNELKEKSLLFRVLNIIINPFFNKLRDSIVTKEEKEQARIFADEVINQDKQLTGTP